MNTPLHVLVVDDDEMDRRAAHRALLAGDQAVIIQDASSCAQALDRLEAQPPLDLILLDYQLPDGDGLEVLRRSKALRLSTPVIMLTGHGDEMVAVELMKAGAVDYLSKSTLSSEALWRSVHGAFRLAEARAEAEGERRARERDLRRSEERYRSLLDSMAEIVWTTAPSGEVVDELPQWAAFTGQSYEEYRGWGWLDAVHPDDRPRKAENWGRTARTESSYQSETRVRRRDGVFRHFAVRAVAVLESDGSVREWVGVHSDITEQRRAEDRRRFLAEASVLLAASRDYEAPLGRIARLAVDLLADACAVDLVDPRGGVVRVAAAAGPRGAVDSTLPAAEDIIRTGLSQHTDTLLAVPMTARGRTLGAITLQMSGQDRRYDGADQDLAEELARRAALAVDNALLYRETRARAEREALVNRIGQALRGSLDPDEILANATREVGQALRVGRCNLSRLNPARDAFEVAPQQYLAPGVSSGSSLFPLDLFPPDLLARWKAGETVAVGDIAPDPDMAFIRRLLKPGVAVTAFMAAPVFLRGEWDGQLVVHQTDGPRDWTAADVALLSAVAATLSLALENARLYAREHRVADMLQAAFLPDIPDRLPQTLTDGTPGLELAKAYRSGLEEAQVGGDLYDAFLLPDGRVALVIADVSGKGLGAAVQTATVKYSLRAFSAEAASPALVLRRLNRTLRADVSGLGEHFVTLFYAVFDPRTGRLTYSSAGHESQLIKRADERVTLLPANGPIMGIAEHRYEQEVEYLNPGDSLVLFTDGLTEARAAGTRELLDLERVAAAVARMDPACGPGAIVSFLEKYALDWTHGKPQDDLALLVARRIDGVANLAHSGLRPSSPPEVFDLDPPEEMLFGFSFPASPDYAAEVRQAVAHWMALLGYGRAQIEDFQTAVTEAVTNAVRHGSPRGPEDTFHVAAFRRASEVFAIEVADSGPGLPPDVVPPPMPSPDAEGGRGLPLMHSLADELTLLPSESGLRVRLVKTRSRDGS